MSTDTLLGGLSPETFLRGYWQKRPLLVRGAIPGFQSPLSPEELAGLACEEGVEARLILERDGDYPWQLRHGPFTEATFTSLPASHWTVLVQDADKYVDGVAAIKERFRFLPDWRIDDVMVSYAAPQGSVGAHVDSYDVFLLQGLGRRRWQINTLPVTREAEVSMGDLRGLAAFTPMREWVLEPGDMLYLPPGVAHHGVALDPCMTYSIGLRAPSHRELLADFLDRLVETVPEGSRYGDPDLTPPAHPGEIAPAVVERLRDVIDSYLSAGRARWAEWVGCMLTDPKLQLQPVPPDEPLSEGALAEQLRRRRLVRGPTSRFAHTPVEAGTWLFADGEAHWLGPEADWLAIALCAGSSVTGEELGPEPARQQVLNTLTSLYNQGCVIFEDE